MREDTKINLRMLLNDLEEILNHIAYRRYLEIMKPNDIEVMRAFLHATSDLDANERAKRINYFYIDKPKPKRWALISEILTATNARAYRRENPPLPKANMGQRYKR